MRKVAEDFAKHPNHQVAWHEFKLTFDAPAILSLLDEIDRLTEALATLRDDGGSMAIRAFADATLLTGRFAHGQPRISIEVAWLIEEWDSKSSAFKARWWTLNGENGEWTKDSLRALRFARKIDAQAYIDDLGWTEAIPTEHRWGR
jgi:hypothetical protein